MTKIPNSDIGEQQTKFAFHALGRQRDADIRALSKPGRQFADLIASGVAPVDENFEKPRQKITTPLTLQDDLPLSPPQGATGNILSLSEEMARVIAAVQASAQTPQLTGEQRPSAANEEATSQSASDPKNAEAFVQSSVAAPLKTLQAADSGAFRKSHNANGGPTSFQEILLSSLVDPKDISAAQADRTGSAIQVSSSLPEQALFTKIDVRVDSIEANSAPPDASIGAQIAYALTEVVRDDAPTPSGAAEVSAPTPVSTSPVRGPMRAIVLDLQPESLGAIRLSFRFSGEALRLRIEVEQPGSLSAVASAHDDIITLLRRQGVSADEITVVATSTPLSMDMRHSRGAHEEGRSSDEFFTRNDGANAGGQGGQTREEGGRRSAQQRFRDSNDARPPQSRDAQSRRGLL